MEQTAEDTAKDSPQYSTFFRWIEIVSIVSFLTFQGFIFFEFQHFYMSAYWTIPVLALLGLIAADFISGLVHWAGDTWGNARWPILGKAFIRPFREHHTDQKALLHHDFVELNGANCLVSIPALAFISYMMNDEERRFETYMALGLLHWTSVWVFFTNMFHQWAHRSVDQNPSFVRWLQQNRVILSAAEHAKHHAPPHLESYCITTGWCNPLLRSVDFFGRLERLITKTTGLPTRED